MSYLDGKGETKEFQAAEPSAPPDYSTLDHEEEDLKHQDSKDEHEEKMPSAPPAPFGNSNLQPDVINRQPQGLEQPQELQAPLNSEVDFCIRNVRITCEHCGEVGLTYVNRKFRWDVLAKHEGYIFVTFVWCYCFCIAPCLWPCICYQDQFYSYTHTCTRCNLVVGTFEYDMSIKAFNDRNANCDSVEPD